MAQLLSGLFFSLAMVGALWSVAAMIRREWPRIVGILSGAELDLARARAPRVRVRQRAWGRPELRTAPQRHAAAA